MFDFSGDEVLCLIIAGIVAVVGTIKFYGPLVSVSLIGRSASSRLVLAIIPLLSLTITTVVLCSWSDPQVKGHDDYIFLFLVVNGAWLTVGMLIFRILGISIRDDAIDRNNSAASVASCGGILGMGIVYALANVGGGPTMWTTIGPAVAATVVLFVIILIMELIGGGMIESITIDRDIASGSRMAGALIGCALVLGRAAGGTWSSVDQAEMDLARFGWPAIVIAVAAGLLHRVRRPSAQVPNPDVIPNGIIPAAVFAIAGLVVVALTPHGLQPSQW